MVVTLLGIVMLVRLEQLPKEEPLMVVKPFGSWIDVIAQWLKTVKPMVFRLLEREMDVRLVQCMKAQSPILVTLLAIVTLVAL